MPLSAPTHIDPLGPLGALRSLACGVALASGAHASAQDDAPGRGDIDLEPPLIEHEVLAETASASRQSFVAQVVDDRDLASVRLFWRYAGETRFGSLPMTQVSSSSTWIAQVPTAPDELRAIEYWIEARDAGGNRTVRGFAFSPLVRRVVPATGGSSVGGPATTGPARPRESRRGAPVTGPVDGAPAPGEGRRTALWVVLGALGVALIVGLASSGGGGGGGGGGGPGDCGAEGCELTITFDPPLAP